MDNFQAVHFKEVVNNKLERFQPGNSLIDQLEKGKSQQISHVLNISEHQQNHIRGRGARLHSAAALWPRPHLVVSSGGRSRIASATRRVRT